MRKVWVVSWHGDSFGGFDWYFNLKNAEEAYQQELTAWGRGPVRVRLVEFEVKAQTSNGVTEEIDGRLDEVEETAAAIRDEMSKE